MKKWHNETRLMLGYLEHVHKPSRCITGFNNYISTEGSLSLSNIDAHGAAAAKSTFMYRRQ